MVVADTSHGIAVADQDFDRHTMPASADIL
jgi:hypothetical protein